MTNWPNLDLHFISSRAAYPPVLCHLASNVETNPPDLYYHHQIEAPSNTSIRDPSALPKNLPKKKSNKGAVRPFAQIHGGGTSLYCRSLRVKSLTAHHTVAFVSSCSTRSLCDSGRSNTYSRGAHCTAHLSNSSPSTKQSDKSIYRYRKN